MSGVKPKLRNRVLCKSGPILFRTKLMVLFTILYINETYTICFSRALSVTLHYDLFFLPVCFGASWTAATALCWEIWGEKPGGPIFISGTL